MADVTKGVTYANGDSVTASGSKGLNNLVDDAQVTNVEQADIASGSGLCIRSSSAPSDTDALWFDTTNLVLKVHNGSAWVQVGAPKKIIFGLNVTNNTTDAVNDIDISTGSAMSSADALLINLTSALVKRIDATFAEGTNQGGRDSADNLTGAKWFRVYLIGDTTANKSPDVFISTSDSPTLPTGYDVYRRIASIRWNGSTIVAFTWMGNDANPLIEWDAFIDSDVIADTTPNTAFGDCNLAAGMPPTAQRAEIQITMGDSNADTCSFYARKNGSSKAIGTTSLLKQFIATGATASYYVDTAWIITDTSQIFEYAADADDGGVSYGYSIRVKAYVDNR